MYVPEVHIQICQRTEWKADKKEKGDPSLCQHHFFSGLVRDIYRRCKAGRAMTKSDHESESKS